MATSPLAIVESTIIAVGIISLLAVVTMRRDFAGSGGTDAATLVIAGKTLVAIHKWTFLLGPGFCAGIESGLMLGYLMYRSGLVPRPIAVLGLAGGSLAFVAATAELFGLFSQVSAGSVPPGTARGPLRGLARDLAHVQGIPAVSRHRGRYPGYGRGATGVRAVHHAQVGPVRSCSGPGPAV